MWIYLTLHVTLIKYGATSSEETFGISNSEKKGVVWFCRSHPQETYLKKVDILHYEFILG